MQGEPQAAIDTLRNKVWRRSVTTEELAQYQQTLNVLSTRLVGGKPQINVFAAEQPDSGFAQVDPSLEDVYFLQLRQCAAQA